MQIRTFWKRGKLSVVIINYWPLTCVCVSHSILVRGFCNWLNRAFPGKLSDQVSPGWPCQILALRGPFTAHKECSVWGKAMNTRMGLGFYQADRHERHPSPERNLGNCGFKHTSLLLQHAVTDYMALKEVLPCWKRYEFSRFHWIKRKWGRVPLESSQVQNWSNLAKKTV